LFLPNLGRQKEERKKMERKGICKKCEEGGYGVYSSIPVTLIKRI
jgi:hypothetical protein